MGTMRAMGMAASVAAGELSMEAALLDHLWHNHYPSLPGNLVKPCIDAIAKADQGEWDAEVQMPDGIKFRDQGFATVRQMVEVCHLEAYLSQDEEFRNEETDVRSHDPVAAADGLLGNSPARVLPERWPVLLPHRQRTP